MTTGLQEKILSHFNEPMLCMGQLVRCIGYGEDEMDCYVIMKQPKPYPIYPHESVFRHTCVGGYFFLDRLRGQQYVRAYSGEDWDDLFRLDNELEYAGATKEKVPVIELQPTNNTGADNEHG